MIARTRFSLSWLIALLLFHCTAQEETPSEHNLPPGFQITRIYSPSEHDQGSWVCLTTDQQGRLIASDQYGDLYRVTLLHDDDSVQVEEIPLGIGRAQGLLWANNSLYVAVNTYPSDEGLHSGIYRLTDSDGDDQLDKVDTLVNLQGAGEHGPHSLVLDPSGKYIYLIAGNHTDIPENFSSFLPAVWQEDRLTPAVKDPRGHANDRGAPGGWIARTNTDGTSWEVMAHGFRNAYDLAFNEEGELFTFDSDMEWDLGTPWYRPTRICHVIPGAEFGWRTGSAKWPDYYADNLPGVLSMGQGSPTGIVFGKGSHFPEKYQKGLFVLDWSFGTIYFVTLQPQAGSYRGESEEFLSGMSMPLTDVVIARDGAMYFTTGGRRSASALYKVQYSPPQSPATTKINSHPFLEARRQLQTLGTDDPGALEKIWAHLEHEDRFLRYSARVQLERLGLSNWQQRLQEPGSPDQIIQSTLALARIGEPSMKRMTLERLSGLDIATLDSRQKLDLVRAYGLLFSRWGAPVRKANITLPEFPSEDAALNRELCELLAFLDDPDIIGSTIPLMERDSTSLEYALTKKEILSRSDQYGPVITAMHDNRPLEQSMSYALSLSQAENGWTPELRTRYFKWFYQSLAKSGGESYKGFLEKIRQQALAKVATEERAQLAELSGETLLHSTALVSETVAPPKGPGRLWEVGEANQLVSDDTGVRSFEHGKNMYQALLCGNCHVMQGEGGNVGPNLTTLSARFSTWDVLQSLQTPSLAISDQYAATLYTLEDGATIIGRTLSSDDDSLYINLNPYQPDVTRAVARSQVVKQELSPVSQMPGGLINQLNEEELLDLMAYLKSGGDAGHEIYP